jgi:hypothetical protein
MTETSADERRLWSSFGKALGAELRETPSIRGASGLEHRLQALCVDDKIGRIILFSDEPNPTVAALIQGDVQASFPDSKVIVARPIVLDLGALVRSIFSDAATAKFTHAEFKKVSDELGKINKLPEKEKTSRLNQPPFAAYSAMGKAVSNAISNVQIPVLSHIGTLVEQASHIDWVQVSEALKSEGEISLSHLYEYDSAAIDREYGVCPIPLYEMTENDWELFLGGTHIDEMRERLKALNILQYFFPAADQLALGLAERGVADRRSITEIVDAAPSQGHPFGEMELISSAGDIREVIDSLSDRHYVTDIDHLIKVTAEGTMARTKIRATPRESVISKLLNRFKFEAKVNIRASTKDLGAGR